MHTTHTSRGISRGIATVVVGFLIASAAHADDTPASLARAAGASSSGLTSAEQGASNEDFQFARRLSRVFKTVADQCEPAVVHITSQREIVQRDMWTMRAFRRRVPGGVGSGFIVDSDGYIITNHHVINGTTELMVKLNDGRQLPARVVGADPSTDLAVLKLEGARGERFPSIALAESDDVQVGEWVVAIGSPFGLDNSVTQGIISAKGRTISTRETGMSYEDYIQTDAAINPGNSGGPLLSLEGKVVGVNSAIASRSGGYDGLGFAIPASIARSVYENIRSNGRLVRGVLGVTWNAGEQGEDVAGVKVQGVIEGSPAHEAGLKEGDVIMKVQGQPATARRFRRTLDIAGPGANVVLEVQRGGKTRTIDVKLADAEAFRAQWAKSQGMAYLPALGLTVRTLTPDLARRLGYSTRVKGVLVTEVSETSRSADLVRVNDVVVAIDDEPVTSAEEIESLAKERDLNKAVRVNVIREGMRGYVEVPE